MIRFVFFLLLLAAALYAVFWAIDRRNSAGPTGPARPRPRGPLGPDDDPDFLRNLDLRPGHPNPGTAPEPNAQQKPPKKPPKKPQPNAAPDDEPNAGPPPTSQETHDHPE